MEEPAFAGALHALEASPLLPYLAQQPELLKRPDAAFLVGWVHSVLPSLPMAPAPATGGKAMAAAGKSRIPLNRKSLGAAQARSHMSIGAGIDRPASPPEPTAASPAFSAFGTSGTDFEGSISSSPLVTDPPPRPAPLEPAEPIQSAFEAMASDADPTDVAEVQTVVGADDAAAIRAFEAALFGQQSPAPTMGPTPRITSPTKTVRPTADGSDGLRTPSLEGSPPKSIGKSLLSRSRGDYSRHDVLAGPDTPELYMRQPDLTSPPSPSPPKSIGKSLRKQTAAERAAPLDDAGAATWDEDDDGYRMEADAPAAAASPHSPAVVDKSEMPWVYGATTPLSGRQLRLTPARKSRQSRTPGGGTVTPGTSGKSSFHTAENASRNGQSSGKRKSSIPRLATPAGVATAVFEAMDAAADEPATEPAAEAAAEPAAAEPAIEPAAAAPPKSRIPRKSLGGSSTTPVNPPLAADAAPAPAVVASCGTTMGAPDCDDTATVESPPAAAESAAATATDGALRELDLSVFPATFQKGAASEQLAELYAAIATAEFAPTVYELTVELKLDARRVALLIDVLHSRKIITSSEGHGATRQWTLPE